MGRQEKGPVFVAVRRLRFGFLARAAAGDMTESVCATRLRALASFAQVYELETEAAEIIEDAAAMNQGEEWNSRAC